MVDRLVIEKTIKKVISEMTGIEITDYDVALRETVGIDSLDFIEIAMKIEIALSVEFTDEDLEDVISLNHFVDLALKELQG